jgi:hypothetical protein
MKSFLNGKKSLGACALRSPHAPAPASAHGHVKPAPSAAPAGAHVEVVKQGDKVVRLIVSCSCGEKIEVDCLYPANG